MEQMGQGNFSTPVPEGGYSREVDELVQGVKAMAGELDSLYTTLEEKVGSRTRLYREANEMLEEQRPPWRAPTSFWSRPTASSPRKTSTAPTSWPS